jgi:ABC-2 type transport system permease protein
MINLFEFEVKKFVLRKKNMISIVAFILLTIVFILSSDRLEIDKTKYQVTSNNYTLETLENSYQKSVGLMNSTNDAVQKKSLSDVVTIQLQQINTLKEKQISLQQGDWKKTLTLDIEFDKLVLQGLNNGSIQGENSQTVKGRISKNELFLKNNMEPIFEDCSCKGLNLIIILFTNIVPLLSILFIFLLFGDSVSNELETGSIKLMLSQSVSRRKLFFIKLFSNIFLCLLLYIFIFGISFLICGFVKGFGSSNYPLTFYSGNFSFTDKTSYMTENISAGVFIRYILFFFPFIICCFVSIGTMMSVLFKNSATSISIGILLYITSYVFTFQFGFLKTYARFLPSTYTNIPKLLNGELITELNNKLITYSNGLILLMLVTILCSIVAAEIFNKRDIIC